MAKELFRNECRREPNACYKHRTLGAGHQGYRLLDTRDIDMPLAKQSCSKGHGNDDCSRHVPHTLAGQRSRGKCLQETEEICHTGHRQYRLPCVWAGVAGRRRAAYCSTAHVRHATGNTHLCAVRHIPHCQLGGRHTLQWLKQWTASKMHDLPDQQIR